MIQELLRGGGGGGGGLMEERKIAIPTALLLDGHSPSSTSITPPLSSSTTSSPSSAADNLKCPRCDSSNTKFCYYNNYNLTQPRHFCKTCRRYWTKGGALRNVPIGGGCRKSKSSGGSSIGATTGKIGGIKNKTNGFCDGMTTGIKPTFSEARGGDNGFGSHEFSHSPFLCTPASHSSNLLSLLRDHTNPNPSPNPNLNFVRIKEDLSHLVPDATLVTNALNARLHGFDHNMGHVPISNPIIWKNNHYQQYHHHHQQQQQQQQQQILQQNNNYNNNYNNNNYNNNNNNNNMLFGTEVQTTSGIQELYQRLRSTNNNYGDQQCQVILGNILGSSSSYSSSPLLPISSSAAMTTATTITASTSHAPSAMDQIPISSSGQFGIGWNLPMTWSDHMPATSCGLEN